MKIIKSICLIAFSFFYLQSNAATQINTPTVNGTWTLANSPYYIHNDIKVPLGQSLTINPGVEVVFMGSYKFEVLGTISAIGTPEKNIIFKANDTTNWNNFSIPDGGWIGMYTYISHFTTGVAFPSFEYCVFRDIKSFQNSAFIANYLNMSINNCQFFNNYSIGGIISASYFGNNSMSKLKFTNNTIYNNIGAGIMTTLLTDSSIVKNNKFYNNSCKYDVFAKNSLEDTSNNVLIFEGNEMYNNNVSENAAIFVARAGGTDFIRNNKVHHNSTTLKGAVSVQSRKALVEGNLISNNNRIQKDGFFCGINDGGGGLHLLGSTVLDDVPNMNIFTVRNNVIANNYSDMDGAGIWANHCKVNIVNNTIINNQSKDPGAAIHGWGRYCKVIVQNNIIHGNKLDNSFYDTNYYNFKFSPSMLEVNIANNLIDFAYGYAPANILGLSQNSYDHNITLTNPSMGSGVSYDGSTADFSPIASSSNIINKGNNNVLDYGTKDYLGNSRIVNGIIDLGAIEYRGNGNTKVNNINLAKNISLYPVPANDLLHLENNYSDQIKTIQIIGMDGFQVETKYEVSANSYKINVSQLPIGNYILNITFIKGESTSKVFNKK